MNNVIEENTVSNSYGIYNANATGQVNVYYNHVDNSHTTEISTGFTFSSNNTTASTVTLNAFGCPTSGTPIDGGNPAAPYYDLDLSVGDAGPCGGSFAQSNFFPIFTGAARVYFVNYPFNVRTGSTLTVRGYSFDR